MIYWFTGQSGSGKTTIASKLKIWLNADKRNWRKSVHVIDESDMKDKFTEESYTTVAFYIARFLSDKGDDVIVSLQSPNRMEREEYKSKTKFMEIYCHTKARTGNGINPNYEPPQEKYVDLDTTSDPDLTFKKLIRMVI